MNPDDDWADYAAEYAASYTAYGYLWGVPHAGGKPYPILPMEERCIRCDRDRIHDYGTDKECAPGFCADCCAALKKASA